MNSKYLTLLIWSFLIITSCKNTEENMSIDEIHAAALTIDTHVDTPMRMVRDSFDIYIRNSYEDGGSQVDIPRMMEGGLDAIFFVVYSRQTELTDENYKTAYDAALKTFEVIHSSLKAGDDAELALKADDAERLKKENKRAIYIGLENGFPIENDISRIEEFYNLGARYIGLCHTANNQLSDSSTDNNGPIHNGLSELGKEAVKEMNRLGMLIDASHLSDDAIWDILKISKHPIAATHSGAKAICDHPRNLNDDLIKAIAEKGGVIHPTFLPSYVKTIEQDSSVTKARNEIREKYRNFQNLSDDEMAEAMKAWEEVKKTHPVKLPTISDFVDHIDYIVELVGIDHVGVGSDFDGGGALEDCKDVSEMKNVTKELVARGYSKSDIEKIWGGNFLRVMRAVEMR
jgi:membrane dipeptidase